LLNNKTIRRLAFRIANAAFVVICFVYISVLFNHPYVGLSLENRGVEWTVTSSDPHGESYRAGIRVGDTVYKINNADPGAHSSIQKWGDAEGATEITVQSPGEPLKVVRIAKQSFAFVLLSALPMVALGFVFWLIGLVTVFKQPFLVQARALFWLNWLVGIVIIIAPASSRGLILAKELELIGFSIVPVLLVKFIYVFVNERTTWSRLIIWVLGVISTLVITILALKGLGAVFTIGVIRKLALVNGLIGTVTAFWSLVKLIRLPKDKPEKNQAAVLLAGLAVGLLPFVILTAIPMLLNANPIIDSQVSTLSVAIIPIILSYVVVSESLPDGSEFLGFLISFLIYGILTSGLLTCFLLVIRMVKKLNVETYLSLLSLTMVALVIYNLIKALLQTTFDKILDTRGNYNLDKTHAATNGKLSTMNQALIVEELVNHLAIEGAFVISEDMEGWTTNSSVGCYLENTADQAIMEDYYQTAKRTMQSSENFTNNFPAEIYIPFITNDFTCGIFLGHRQSNVRFQSNEILFITSVCYQMGQRLKAIHLIKKMSREINVMEKKTRDSQRRSQGLEVINRLLFSNIEEEKKVLARELHDGSLQISLELNRRMKELAASFSTEDGNFNTVSMMLEMIEDLNYELRSICGDLRPSSLRDLGLIPAVEVLFQQIMQKELLVISLEITGMSREQRFKEELEVVAFRLLQEGINNVVKHSGSTKANVSIALIEEKIEVLVYDCGQGFDPQKIPDWSLSGNHFGIIGMKERIQSLGGEFDIISSIGHGVKLKATIPI